MEYNLKNRKYKEASPFETICNIRKILQNIDCFVHESMWTKTYENIISVRIEELAGFGTNGKGKNEVFALASAYGEFMERLQNNLYPGASSFSRCNFVELERKTGFNFYPDEKRVQKSEILNLPKKFQIDVECEFNTTYEEYMNSYFERIIENGFDGVLAVPYYDIVNNKNVYFPMNIMHSMTGSNGMAAGNTKAEAIFQGCCELLERYSTNLVYYSQQTPPSIPDSFLKKFSEQYAVIKEIEKEYKVIIKDFSAGKKIPSVGVIIIDEKTQKYRLNVGCDTHFSIALSRCLSEVFQGIKYDNIKDLMLPIPKKQERYFMNEDFDSKRMRKEEYKQFCINGQGVFPKSLFEDASANSYEFDSTVFNNGDTPYEDQVIKLKDIISELGMHIYVRDVSFLGFPSFHIYVPQLSILGQKKPITSVKEDEKLINRTLGIDKVEDLLFPIKTIDNIRINELLSVLEKYSDAKMENLLKLEFHKNNIWSTIKVEYFIIIFSIFIKDYHKAIKYLKNFINTNKLENSEYYKIALTYLTLLSKKNISDSDLLNKLGNKYSLPVCEEVMYDFKQENILNGILWPNCPNCNSCSLNNDCKTQKKLDLGLRINTYVKNSDIKQEHLNTLFNN